MPNIKDAYYDLGVRLHILVVTDGAISLWDVPTEPAGNNEGFTLRQMARALWDRPTTTYPYTYFKIDHAIHGTGPLSRTVRSELDPETGKTRVWTQYDGFRFDDPGFNLAAYTQVWFFGFWPGNPNQNGQFSTPQHRPQLSAAELQRLAAWMNAGGGVFATGDHGMLGAHLCAELSRVRQMRRWVSGVPSSQQSDRIDTIVPVRTAGGYPEVQFDDQSDAVPKPLRLKRYSLWDATIRMSAGGFDLGGLPRTAPHPLLCSPLGAIDILPDHMHEGLVREDAEVRLDAIDPTGAAEFPGGANRPKPEVIAWATVRGEDVVYDDLGSRSVQHRVVPTIAVYDGQRAKVGRVVVDATWHNWLDINVRGTGAGAPVTGLAGKNLELMNYYFRNIAQWLATPYQREWMRDGLLVHLAANTGGWSELLHMKFAIGQRALDVLGQVTSECERRGFVFEPWLTDAVPITADHNSWRALALPSSEFVAGHVLGTMVQEAFELIPELQRMSEEEDPAAQAERSGRALPLLTERMRLARKQGLRDMAAQWRLSLDATAQLVDAIADAAEEGTPPDVAGQ